MLSLERSYGDMEIKCLNTCGPSEYNRIRDTLLETTMPNILGNINRNSLIYRIFTREHFFNLFEEKTNTLVLPEKWQDPFENFLSKSKVRRISGEFVRFRFRQKIYAQCWSTHNASDAMWRIYSPHNTAVRVRSTVGKLLDSLCTAQGKTEETSCYVGRVEYLTEENLREFARSTFLHGLGPDALARSLLIKRKAFRHEREVRLIYLDTNESSEKRSIFTYDIAPHELFDQVMIDPRISYKEFQEFKNSVVERTGLPGKKVLRSLLY